MAGVLLVLQIGLSGMLLIAATGKALRSEGFLAALRLSHLPTVLIRPLGIGIPAAEYILAFALLVNTPLTLRIALGAVMVLLTAFTAWMVWVIARQLHLECGCFGPSGAQVGIYTIVRNSFLLFVAASGFVLAGQARSPLLASRWLVIAVTALGLGVALLRTLWEIRPHLVLTLRELEARVAGPQQEA